MDLFRPLEQYAGPSIILTVGVLCFVFLLGCIFNPASLFLSLSLDEFEYHVKESSAKSPSSRARFYIKNVFSQMSCLPRLKDT